MSVVRGLDAALDPQHLPNGVLISVTDLKLFPGLPEMSSHLKEKDHKYTKTKWEIAASH